MTAAVTAAGGGVLLVHAHPDDECFSTGGLIARSVAEGRRVDPEEARPRMHEIRAAELECALGLLRGGGPGELHLHRLGYRDSGMVDTEANKHPESFWRADLDEATGRLVAVIREARPAVLVTYDAEGLYGHPDHINAHRVAVAAMQAAADPSRFADAGPAYAVAKFYEIAFNRDRWFALMGEMRERGIALPWDFDADENGEADAAQGEDEFGVAEADITTFVDVAEVAARKRDAMACHRTQRQDFGWLLDLPDDLAARILTPECFVLTRWPGRPIEPGLREASLFAGLEER